MNARALITRLLSFIYSDFPKLLKKRFGGLKKFIFSHSEFFSREDNHNFNPVVFVVGQGSTFPLLICHVVSQLSVFPIYRSTPSCCAQAKCWSCCACVCAVPKTRSPKGDRGLRPSPSSASAAATAAKTAATKDPQ